MSTSLDDKIEKVVPTDDELLDHEYDGIREYDNPLPKWWVWIFWGSFYFALGYVAWYHLLPNGTSLKEAYEADMAEYREWLAMKDMGGDVTEEGLAGLMEKPEVMVDAAKVFKARCVQCHADKGQGNIGPNLTDDHWIHGQGQLMDIYNTVSNGVVQKGMPAWNRQLTPAELSKVVAFVGTLRGKNLPGKAPEGTRVEHAMLGGPAHDGDARVAEPAVDSEPAAAAQPEAASEPPKEGG